MKTLSERIAERVRAKSANSPRSNRAIILALRKDIQQALDDGWSVRAVYQTLYDENRVTFSYQAFRRYVNQIHLGRPSTDTSQSRQANKTGIKGSAAPASGGFSFDPAPKKTDLF
ncbi:MAG: TraK family protein [Betaproteobacteria bacterium]|nr:TraK family protein [Betaproteobacteria bacterium]